MTRSFSDHADAVIQTVRSRSEAAASPIAASWCRSALHHKIDPGARGEREVVEAARLSALRDANGALLAVARPVLDHLFRTVGRSGCCVVLSDAAGVILDQRVGPTDRDAFAAAGLRQGACWGEAQEGTNGIGTCLYENKPVVIYRDQHYAARNIGISCMDAPVHDPFGGLVAAIDVSTCRSDHGADTVEMVAALVADAARCIERELFCRHFAAARIVLLSDDPMSGTALLAADRDDLVVGATRSARLRLRLADDLHVAPRALGDLLGTGRSPSFADGDRGVLRRALASANGNASKAALSLGIGRATLYRRMARAGLR